MPGFDGWWKFTYGIIQFERRRPGVYELADKDKNVIYIGGAADVEGCLIQHFSENINHCIKKSTQWYRVAYADNFGSQKAEALAEYIRTHGRPPLCNEPSSASGP